MQEPKVAADRPGSRSGPGTSAGRRPCPQLEDVERAGEQKRELQRRPDRCDAVGDGVVGREDGYQQRIPLVVCQPAALESHIQGTAATHITPNYAKAGYGRERRRHH